MVSSVISSLAEPPSLANSLVDDNGVTAGRCLAMDAGNDGVVWLGAKAVADILVAIAATTTAVVIARLG